MCIESYRRFMDPRDWKRPRSPRSFDNRYHLKDLEAFEDNWTLIESSLQVGQ